MKFWAAVVAVVLLGCTKPNPQSCLDGSCTDPAFPFCDVNGELEGIPGTCIAVACTKDELAGCRDDRELRCNALGTNYEVIDCPLGCVEGTGCRLCEPGQTACTNGTLATCDSNGNVVTSQACELGCAAEGPSCARIAPSNNLGRLQDLVVDPPKLVLVSAVFNADDGSVTSGAQPVTVPTALVPRAFPNPAIRVWIVDAIDIDGASFMSAALPSELGPAVAIVARGAINLRGQITVHPRAGGVQDGCVAATPGETFENGADRRASGGGGGGNGTAGGRGGIASTSTVGSGGGVSGTNALVPLRGGCVGGNAGGPSANGGGALQLSTSGLITIEGRVDVTGRVGETGDDIEVGGGGAGGSLLLEAAGITLAATSVIDAAGGPGFQACVTPDARCGAAGTGGSTTAMATNGGTVLPAGPFTIRAGGGGGGLGRVRSNVGRRGFTQQPGAIVNALASQGTVVVAP